MRGRFTLGDATEQAHQRGRPLPRAFTGRATQQRIVAIAGPAALRVIVALHAKGAAVGAPTVWADKAVGVEMPLQPEQAQAIIKQLRDGKINHVRRTPNRTVDGRQYTTRARLLDMSHRSTFTCA